jgi:hypothetical protein
MLHASGLFVGFIGDSSPAARVEGARRSPPLHNKTALRPPGSLTRAAYPYPRPSRPLEGNLAPLLSV